MRYLSRARAFLSSFNRHHIVAKRHYSSLDEEGFTRSIHCKAQFINVTRNGKLEKIPSGLVDRSKEPLGDQFVTLQMKLTYKHDMDLNALIKYLHSRVRERNRRRQILSGEAIQHLGLDLAMAQMLCNIGGRVQFVGNDKWFQCYAGLPAELPRNYAGDIKIEAIDLSGVNVVYEGFEFMPDLEKLRFLRLKRCVHVDDFCLSRVSRIKSLELLDVGECPRLTSKGLATVSKLNNLRRLLVGGNPLMEDRELVCLLLEEHLPMLYVSGVDYIDRLPVQSRENILALIAGKSNDERTTADSMSSDHTITSTDNEEANIQVSNRERSII